MRSLPAWIDNEISLLSKQDFLGCRGIDSKNNASVGEAPDKPDGSERSATPEVTADERTAWTGMKF